MQINNTVGKTKRLECIKIMQSFDYNDFISGSTPTSFKIIPIGVAFDNPIASEALTNLFFIFRSLSDACNKMKHIGNVTPNKNTKMEPNL